MQVDHPCAEIYSGGWSAGFSSQGREGPSEGGTVARGPAGVASTLKTAGAFLFLLPGGRPRRRGDEGAAAAAHGGGATKEQQPPRKQSSSRSPLGGLASASPGRPRRRKLWPPGARRRKKRRRWPSPRGPPRYFCYDSLSGDRVSEIRKALPPAPPPPSRCPPGPSHRWQRNRWGTTLPDWFWKGRAWGERRSGGCPAQFARSVFKGEQRKGNPRHFSNQLPRCAPPRRLPQRIVGGADGTRH
jgi:hypothetical protein